MGLGTCCDNLETSKDLVLQGLSSGYRLLDTAAHYESESAVGEALSFAEERGLVRRAEVQICTKIWMDDMGYEKALAAATRSLKRLRSEYVDVLLVHFPGNIDAIQDPKANRRLRADTWRALEKLQADGRATRIGVSNWTRRHLRETLASCARSPEVLQVELHPMLQQRELVEDASAAGLSLMAFCPLAHGERALLDDPTMRRLAMARGCSPAQLAIRWSIDRGFVPIPKASSRTRLDANLAAAAMPALTDIESRELDALDQGLRVSFNPGLIA